MTPALTRRKFLKTLSLAGASFLLTGCQPPHFTAAPTLTLPTGGVTQTVPSPVPTLSPTLTDVPTTAPTLPWQASVAIARVNRYDPLLLRQQMEGMFQSLGGLADLVRPGSRVGIKLNLTGGTWWDTPDKPPATEYFVTHPSVAGVLVEILRDLGASQVTLMDGLGDPASFEKWGYAEMAKKLGAQLVDLCLPSPYASFMLFPVGSNSLVYPQFYLHPTLHELDVFISLAKLKCHTTTGVTLALKNLIGIAPTSAYRRKESDNNRSAFHGDIRFDTRLPRVIIDLNRARPVHLALIDGILTAEAGAGPWDKNMAQVAPGLMLAGRNPVAVDAVAAAVMGFNPEAANGVSPFVGGENHLALASEAGLGTHRLAQIQILGPTIQDVIYPFKAAR